MRPKKRATAAETCESYELILAGLEKRLQPQGDLERDAVERLAHLDWSRAQIRLRVGAILREPPSERQQDRIDRLERNFNAVLDLRRLAARDFETLREDRAKAKPGDETMRLVSGDLPKINYIM